MNPPFQALAGEGRNPLLALLCLASVAGGCSGDPAAQSTGTKPVAWLQQVDTAPWSDFRYEGAPENRYYMPQITGGAAAFLDVDNDGRLDIYVLQNAAAGASATPHRLYRQDADGRFHDVSAGSGLDFGDSGQGVAVGDVDNDGDVDVAVTAYGQLTLLSNDGGGHFTDVSSTAGIASNLWGVSACFVDYDRDGWLDLAVANYVEYDPTKECVLNSGQREFCGPSAFRGTVTSLFRNISAGTGQPTFENVTVAAGLGTHTGPGLGLVCADLNGDQWPDLLVANDGRENHLWINDTQGSFSEEGLLRGVAYNMMGAAEASMGIAVGDVNDDGLTDLLMTHLTSERHRLWLQGPPGQFEDGTGRANLATSEARSTGFGALFADFDHDGDLDLALANGSVSLANTVAGGGDDFWADYAERNGLFANTGNGSFEAVDGDPFTVPLEVSRGLAVADVDNDGDLDLLVTSIDAGVRLYHNVAEKKGHWLMVRAIDPRLKRDAYGAQVDVHAGARRWMRWVNPAYSYATSNDPRAHFGLGEAAQIDHIDVLWPDGLRERFGGGQVDRLVVVRRGQGRPLETKE